MTTKIFSLIVAKIIASIVMSNHPVKTEFIDGNINHCAQHMEKCDINFYQPCCNPQFQCKRFGWGALQSELRCLRKASLGEFCKSTSDCQQTNYAKCSKNSKCECEQNFIVVNNSICLSPLNGYCSSNTDCITDNSNCIDFQCKCKLDFIATPDNRCEQRYLKNFCEVDSDCDEILHAKCSKNKKCVCRPNNIQLNGTLCVPKINAFCWKNERCAVDNSVCIDHVCKCKPGYKLFPSIDSCLDAYYGMPCQGNNDCKKLINAKCSKMKKQCVCKNNTTRINITTCAPILGSYCDNDEQCLLKNSACFDNECKCISNYIADGNSNCQFVELGTPCKSNLDCRSLHLAECNNDYRCACKSNTLAVNQTTCLSLIGGFCYEHEQCLPGNTHCIISLCQCKPDYIPTSNNRCVLNHSARSCRNTNDCGDEMRQECDKNNKCICKSYTLGFGNSDCLSLIGGYCERNDECVVENSICIDKECRCGLRFQPISYNKCL